MIGMNRRVIAHNNRVFLNGEPLFDQAGELTKRHGTCGFTLKFGSKTLRQHQSANLS
jgi:hypothetical protein